MMDMPYLCVFLESFQGGAWSALGVWRQGPKGLYMSHPVYVNIVDDFRRTLHGLLHPQFDAWRAEGCPRLHTVDGLPPGVSAKVASFMEGQGKEFLTSWISVQEMREYPWEDTIERSFLLTPDGANWFDLVGVPREEDLVAPKLGRSEARRLTLTPEDLWGRSWVEGALPKILRCDPEDRVLFLFTDEYRVR